MESGSGANPVETDLPEGYFRSSKQYFDSHGQCKLHFEDGKRCTTVIKSKTGNKTRHLNDTHLLKQLGTGTFFVSCSLPHTFSNYIY